MLYVYTIDRLSVCAYAKEFISPMLRNARYASLPLKKKYYTVLRSPHVDKKSREQFEFSTVKMIVYQKSKTLLPAGVSGVCDRRVLAVYGSAAYARHSMLCRLYGVFK